MIECRNCGHEIERVRYTKKDYVHCPKLRSAFRKGGCEWNCDCTKPEPTSKK